MLGSGASAQDPGARTLTLKELDKGSTFTHIRNTKTSSQRANSQGDVIAFTNPLADESGKVVGKLSADCTTTTGSRNFVKSTITCLVVARAARRQPDGPDQREPEQAGDVGAVTGGTGAYANARGVVVSKPTKSGIHRHDHPGGRVMEQSVNRPAVDIAPDRPRPGLALVLALLAVPGSTIAWALPAGGLWIGLPLAVAAIVLGLRARRRPSGSAMAIAAIVIAGLCIAQMVVYSIVAAVS